MTRLSIGGKSRKGVNRSQARSQVVIVWGYLTPHVGLGEVGQSLPGGLLVRGGADRP